ncbi:cilia- and flagella-associated protein 206 [Euwallacea similis]|uniref:cilia- and flagella-associated protein 206 n=1 Tax=Euwallacea similis TaxID=1736056 RepID=UPI00344FDC99
MDDDTNGSVRNMVKEIMRELAPKKIRVNKNFVTYLTKLLLMDPNWGIGDDFFRQRENVQHFVKYVIEDLLQQQNYPKIVTLKLQFYFSCNLERMDHVIELNKRDLKNKLSSLKENIFMATKVEEKEEIDLLFKKIVYYITLSTGLGNPSKPKVYEEALIALKSILDEAELKDFAAMSKFEKHNNLTQVTKVVAGIRLFNKDCEKGGEGIPDLPSLLEKAVAVIKAGTEETLLMVMERVNALTTMVDKCYVVRHTCRGFQLQCITGEDMIIKNSNDVEYIKDLLVFFRQYELLIRRILDEIDHMPLKSEEIWGSMEKLLKIIHETVYMKIAIPIGVVFPLFEQLWEVWEHFQNQSIFLSRLSMIMSNLEVYARYMRYDHLPIEQIIRENSSMTDAERLAETAHIKLISTNPDIKVVKCEAVKNFQNIKLEYLGFCCWKLIESDGALIPGNPNMGIAVYNLKRYVFSCKEGFREFQKDPQMFVNCVLDLARRKPQFIHFFQMKNELESVYKIEKLVQNKIEIRICEDKSMQTVVHTTESHIDPQYHWNIWDIKREALTNANLLMAGTISSQTNKTGGNSSLAIETYNLKTRETQTFSPNYINVAKSSTFMNKLRRNDDPHFNIDLTRSVEE